MDASPGNVRLFLALWPEDDVRAALVDWRNGFQLPKIATPVPDEKLHLTLHFLGMVPTARLAELAEAFRVPFTPFQLELGVPTVWHDKIAVLEPLSIPQGLRDLHATLGDQVRAAGLPLEERSYKPHVTMSRRAGGATLPSSGPHIRWPIGGYVLMQSQLGPRSTYSIVQQY